MVEIAAFRGLRYDPDVAGDPLATSAPAYDDLGQVAYAEHRAGNPYTVLELIAPRRGGYRAAADTWERWLRTGVLRAEAEDALYRYEQHEVRDGVPTVQRGLLAAVRLEPFGRGVLPHERIEPDRMEARRRRLAAVPVDLAPVFALTSSPVRAVRAVLDRPPPDPPVVALTDERGLDHRIWALTDPADHDALARALAPVSVVIADGHHRYAAALEAGATHTLMYIVDPSRHGPRNGPRIRPIHRLVDPAPADLAALLSADFRVQPAAFGCEELAGAVASAPSLTFGLCQQGLHAVLVPRDDGALRARLPAAASASWRSLDAAVLHHAVLPRLGADVRVTFHTDVAVPPTERGALFLLRPPPLETVMSLASQGELLPPKTTSFEPKPRTGLVLRPLGG